MPARLRVDTNAIGLGTNAEIIRRYESLSGRDDGSTIMDGPAGRNVGLTINDSRYNPLPKVHQRLVFSDDGGPLRPPLRPRLRCLQRAVPGDPSRRPPQT